MAFLKAILGVGAIFIILTALNMTYMIIGRYITNFNKTQKRFEWLDQPVFRKKSIKISRQKKPRWPSGLVKNFKKLKTRKLYHNELLPVKWTMK